MTHPLTGLSRQIGSDLTSLISLVYLVIYFVIFYWFYSTMRRMEKTLLEIKKLLETKS